MKWIRPRTITCHRNPPSSNRLRPLHAASRCYQTAVLLMSGARIPHLGYTHRTDSPLPYLVLLNREPGEVLVFAVAVRQGKVMRHHAHQSPERDAASADTLHDHAHESANTECGTTVNLQIGPLPGGANNRIVRIPIRWFLGSIGFLLIVVLSTLGYAWYRSGLLPF